MNENVSETYEEREIKDKLITSSKQDYPKENHNHIDDLEQDKNMADSSVYENLVDEAVKQTEAPSVDPNKKNLSSCSFSSTTSSSCYETPLCVNVNTDEPMQFMKANNSDLYLEEGWLRNEMNQ
jgi:hypothetical protein